MGWLHRIIDRIVSKVGRRVDETSPMADTQTGYQREQERQSADRWNTPAVVAEGRAKCANTVDAIRLLGGQTQGKQSSHGKSTDKKILNALAQEIGRHLHAGKPVFRVTRQQVVHVAAMPCELHAVDREAGLVEALAEYTHFVRRTGQAMYQQDAAGSTFEEKIGFLDHGPPQRRNDCSGSRQSGESSLCDQGFNDLSTPQTAARRATRDVGARARTATQRRIGWQSG